MRVKVNGDAYWLNPESTALYHARHSVPKIARMVELIEDAQSIFDVGANCGLFAALCAQKFPTANIHAFEPANRLQPMLAHNCAAANISIHPMAVGEREEVVTLYVHPDSQQANSLQPSAVAAFLEPDKIETETTRCVAIDSFMAEHSIDHVDVLKVDVQGSEGAVLRGARSALSTVRYLFVEASWLDPESVQRLLPAAEHHGFNHVAVVNPVHTGADLLFTREPLSTDIPSVLRFPIALANDGRPWF
ncbi:FkbM family methyltransferase [Mycobacterium simiae]|uniref:FkbM family methyltransferase n=1 Tax=Mycobacterium simiae TaxID=1784 RepID=UPI0026106E1D|nr:FkbM family methyltransferase [Mycobacterium simiae]